MKPQRLIIRLQFQLVGLSSNLDFFVFKTIMVLFSMLLNSSVQLLSHVWLFATPWTAACQASLSITISQSLLKLMSIELGMPSNHLILCCPLLHWPSIFPSIRVFSRESVLHIRWLKYWSLSIGMNMMLNNPLLNLESPFDCKEIQPVHPKGDQSWVFIGSTDVEAETPIFWPPDAKSWLVGKDPDAGKDGGQEEKGMTEDEMVGWHHRLDKTWVWVDSGSWWWTGRPGVLRFMGRKELDATEWLNWTEITFLDS